MLVSLCTVCKNRSEHLKKTIFKNIEDNKGIDNVEFVLLDYNSDDGLEAWVRDNLYHFIESRRLNYYKTFEPKYFHRSHSRNMLFRLANGNLLCNVDADNFTGPNFSKFLIDQFAKERNIFICAGGQFDNIACSDIGGRICLHIEDFNQLGGYDEEMRDYGYEDWDLIYRLEAKKIKKVLINDKIFLNTLKHGKIQRIAEEFSYKNLEKILIHYINPAKSIIILVFLDNTFAHGTLLNERNVSSAVRSQEPTNLPKEAKVILAEGKWTKGTVGVNTYGQTIFSSNDGKVMYTVQISSNVGHYNFFFDKLCLEFYTLTRPNLIEEAILFFSETLNLWKLEQNAIQQIINPNHSGIGKGIVYKNFNYHTPIYLY